MTTAARYANSSSVSSWSPTASRLWKLLMALKPAHLVKAIEGMKALSKNGFRYPIPPYGVQMDVRAGMNVSYGNK